MNWPLLRFFLPRQQTEAQSTNFKVTLDTTVMHAWACRGVEQKTDLNVTLVVV